MNTNQTPETFDIEKWKDITREDIIEQFNLTKYQVLLIIEKFYFEMLKEDSPISFEFPFFDMFNEEKQDFEDIMNNELDEEASKIPQLQLLTDQSFVEQFYQTISHLEKLQIVREWYVNGMYAPIIQSEEGTEIDEFCEMIIQCYYEDINEYKNPKNK
jgi:hypothetical protein